ncbi:hypothetical protein ACLOJK_017126 [Asimina triloba]
MGDDASSRIYVLSSLSQPFSEEIVRLQPLSPRRNRRLQQSAIHVQHQRLIALGTPLFSFAPALVRPDLAAPGPSVGVRVSVSLPYVPVCVSVLPRLSSATQILVYRSVRSRSRQTPSSSSFHRRQRPDRLHQPLSDSNEQPRSFAHCRSENPSRCPSTAARRLLPVDAPRRLRPLAVRQRDWPLVGDPNPPATVVGSVEDDLPAVSPLPVDARRRLSVRRLPPPAVSRVRSSPPVESSLLLGKKVEHPITVLQQGIKFGTPSGSLGTPAEYTIFCAHSAGTLSSVRATSSVVDPTVPRHHFNFAT